MGDGDQRLQSLFIRLISSGDLMCSVATIVNYTVLYTRKLLTVDFKYSCHTEKEW